MINQFSTTECNNVPLEKKKVENKWELRFSNALNAPEVDKPISEP